MIDKRLMRDVGLTANGMARIFTAKEGTTDFDNAQRVIKRIRSRIENGMRFCMSRSDLHLASDKAWDTPTISKEQIPLDLLAQGHISVDACKQSIGEDAARKWLKEDDKQKGVLKVNAPKLYNFNVNMTKAYVSRRFYTLKRDFSGLFPFFKYDPEVGSSLPDRLKADVMSQIAENMVDAFGVRQHTEDAIRAMLMYPDVFSFPKSRWEKRISQMYQGNLADKRRKSVVVAEGVDFEMPHPSRVYYDTSKAPAYFNSDNGPDYIGYWDIVPYRTIKRGGSGLFNTKAVQRSATLSNIAYANLPFFEYYFDKSLRSGLVEKQADPNDRGADVKFYTDEEVDKGVFYTRHFERINPKDEFGIDYPESVWMEFWMASDETVIYANVLPSRPCAYLGANNAPNRITNTSFLHDILPFQDQISAILSQMIHDVKTAAVRVWWINQDVLTPAMREALERGLKGEDYLNENLFAYYSLVEKEVEGMTKNGVAVDIANLMRVSKAEMGDAILNAVRAIDMVMNQADRVLMISDQERGQPAPREISASEVTIIQSTTDTIISSLKESVNKYRDAMKQVLYDHWFFEKYGNKEPMQIPVINQYDETVVKKAGLSYPDNSASPSEMDAYGERTIWVDDPAKLVFNQRFTSRDGDSRSLTKEGAQTLVQALQVMSQDPAFSQVVGNRRKVQMLSEIMRGIGSTVNMKFTEEEMEGGTMREIDALKEAMTRMGQAVRMLYDEVMGGPQGGGQSQPSQGPVNPASPAGPSGPAVLGMDAMMTPNQPGVDLNDFEDEVMPPPA